jgi:hypothetical protein
MLLLVGCGIGPAAPEEPVVAEAYGNFLYTADLRAVIPAGTPAPDSTALAEAFIANWLRKRVLLHRAEINLSDVQKDVQRQLEDYRSSLLIFAYEQAVVREKLDTAVTDADIAAYYAANEKNFELKDNIVRARWFKLRENDRRVLRKVEDLWRSERPEDRHQLEVLLAQRGAAINDTRDMWIPFTELQQQVPLRPDNPTDWLAGHDRAVVADSVGTFFVDLLEHRLKNSVSPVSLVRSEIRAVIINQRKLRLVEQLREELVKDAFARKEILVR